PRSPDEKVTCDVLYGRAVGEKRPDLVVCVVDATNLRRNLRLVLAVKRLGLPCVVALNMMDLAERRGIAIDPQRLSEELGVPVVSTVGVATGGDSTLRELLDQPHIWRRDGAVADDADTTSIEADHETVRRILERLGLDRISPHTTSDRIDRIVLHPVAGPVLLAIVLFLIFQAVFSWAEAPMEAIESLTTWAGETVSALLPDGWPRSLLVDGIIAGA